MHDELLKALSVARSNREQVLFDLLESLRGIPVLLADLAERLTNWEMLVVESGTHSIRWEAWNGAAHSAAYLVELRKEAGAKPVKKLVGNLFSSDLARHELRSVIGRNNAISYLRDIDQYRDIKSKVTKSMAAEDIRFAFAGDRKLHPVMQWTVSMEPFWEALISATKHNIERFLKVDEEASEQAFAFNFEAQPIRWRSVICRQRLLATDPLSPSFPELRVVTNICRVTGRRQTTSVESYKRKLILTALKKAMEQQMGRTVALAEVKVELSKKRNRAVTPWLTKELIEHCRLGRKTTAINSRQRKLKQLHAEWHDLKERLATLL